MLLGCVSVCILRKKSFPTSTCSIHATQTEGITRNLGGISGWGCIVLYLPGFLSFLSLESKKAPSHSHSPELPVSHAQTYQYWCWKTKHYKALSDLLQFLHLTTVLHAESSLTVLICCWPFGVLLGEQRRRQSPLLSPTAFLLSLPFLSSQSWKFTAQISVHRLNYAWEEALKPDPAQGRLYMWVFSKHLTRQSPSGISQRWIKSTQENITDWSCLICLCLLWSCSFLAAGKGFAFCCSRLWLPTLSQCLSHSSVMWTWS